MKIMACLVLFLASSENLNFFSIIIKLLAKNDDIMYFRRV